MSSYFYCCRATFTPQHVRQFETESEKRERLEDEKWELASNKARLERRLARQAKKDAEEIQKAKIDKRGSFFDP